MFIALILTDGRFFIGAIDMSTLLAMLARATDTKGYPDDKNPDHWRKIHGSPVHLDASGNIDGGAGGKFGGKAWTSETHPHRPESYPKPAVTVADLKTAWKKVIKYQVAMKQSKTEGTYQKNAEKLKEAIAEYEGIKKDAAPEVQKGHNPKIDAMKAFAESKYMPKAPAEAPGEATLGTLAAAVTLGTKENPFPLWDKAKRKAAKMCERAEDADKILRSGLVSVWAKASAAERNAAFEYSFSFKQFQEPLRGRVYGSSRETTLEDMPWDTLGVGSMGKRRGEVKKYINDLTSLISKSRYDKDVTLVRGTGMDSITKLFNIDEHTLRYGSIEAIETAIMGREGKDEGFSSCGSSRGTGFDDKDVIMHIACPAGTQMLYLEPFAAYGGDSPYSERDLRMLYLDKEKPKMYWDGKSDQKKFGKQDETLLQRGTTFKATGVKREGGKLHVYCQVICQEPYKIT